MSKKLTNDVIDARLVGRNIRRISDYKNAITPLKFECLIDTCQYIWTVKPSNVISGSKTGCPHCAQNIQLNDDIIDQRLQNRNIKRLSKYNTNKDKMDWQCLINDCKYIWSTTAQNILHGNRTGCPKCAGNARLTNKIIDERLVDRNIQRIGNFINEKMKLEFICLIPSCHYIWLATVKSVIHMKNGCPQCAKQIPLTNEILDARIIDRNIIRLEECDGASKPIKFQCTIEKCKYVWVTSPQSIYGLKTGCPRCSISKNEKLIIKLLNSNNIKFESQKLIRDISVNETNRFRVDFYLPQINTIIEYNGAQHYQPVCFGGIEQDRAETNLVKQQARDLYIQGFCDEHNIQLIWIDGREYQEDKLNQYIQEIIIPMITSLCLNSRSGL